MNNDGALEKKKTFESALNMKKRLSMKKNFLQTAPLTAVRPLDGTTIRLDTTTNGTEKRILQRNSLARHWARDWLTQVHEKRIFCFTKRKA